MPLRLIGFGSYGSERSDPLVVGGSGRDRFALLSPSRGPPLLVMRSFTAMPSRVLGTAGVALGPALLVGAVEIAGACEASCGKFSHPGRFSKPNPIATPLEAISLLRPYASHD